MRKSDTLRAITIVCAYCIFTSIVGYLEWKVRSIPTSAMLLLAAAGYGAVLGCIVAAADRFIKVNIIWKLVIATFVGAMPAAVSLLAHGALSQIVTELELIALWTVEWLVIAIVAFRFADIWTRANSKSATVTGKSNSIRD